MFTIILFHFFLLHLRVFSLNFNSKLQIVQLRKREWLLTLFLYHFQLGNWIILFLNFFLLSYIGDVIGSNSESNLSQLPAICTPGIVPYNKGFE